MFSMEIILTMLCNPFIWQSPMSPQAPRILLMNQGANMDQAHRDAQPRLNSLLAPDSFPPTHREVQPRLNSLLAPESFLRTPPTIKSKVYLNLGDDDPYRGFSKFNIYTIRLIKMFSLLDCESEINLRSF